MTKTLNIGRNIQNNLVIKLPNVSSRHCSITLLEDNTYLIEDFDSTNGTFVNGKRVKQILLNPDDLIELGGFELDLKLVNILFEQQPLKEGINYEDLKKQEEVFEEFSKLRDIYQDYQKEKRKIFKTSQLKSTGVRVGLSFIPVVGVALGILSSGVTGSPQEKLMELEEDFKKKYICPGCSKFLGAEPFENLEKRGYCHICKTKWKR
jgi:hypothetical protein